MRVWNIRIKASRWPWQENGRWNSKNGMGRFGGGWHYRLGIDIGGSTMILNLLFGLIRISIEKERKHGT